MEENKEKDSMTEETVLDDDKENSKAAEDKKQETENCEGESSEPVENQEEREDEMKKHRDQKNEAKALKEENDTLKDKLLRTVAEYDNFRRRTAKEKENIYTDACADVLKEMLPVLDNLERAMASEGNVEDLRKGVEMTVAQFKTAFDKLGVEEIKADAEFDPNYHNAVMHIDDDSFDKNQVAEVFQKGYKKGDKVLRHSMVKVAN